MGPPFLVENNCLAIQNGGTNAETLGRILNARKAMRPVMTAAGKYPYMAIVQMDGDPVPVPF